MKNKINNHFWYFDGKNNRIIKKKLPIVLFDCEEEHKYIYKKDLL